MPCGNFYDRSGSVTGQGAVVEDSGAPMRVAAPARRDILAAGALGVTSTLLPTAAAAASGALVGSAGGASSWVVASDTDAALTTVDGVSVMQLTTTSPTNQFGFAYYDEAVAVANGLDIRFTMAHWGAASSPGDGMCFFLIDGSTATVTPGYLGGALGYTGYLWNGSSFSINSGLTGGLVGVGFDNLGAYESSVVGPASVPLVGGGGNGTDKLTVRGRRSDDYTVLGTQVAGITGGWSGADSGSTFSSASMRVRITITSAGRIRVHHESAGDTATPFTALTQRMDLSTNVLDGVSTVKFGFSAGTGSVVNNHAVYDDVEIYPFAG